MILMCFSPADFEIDEKPKGDPCKSKIFLLREVYEEGWRGSGSF